MSLLLKLYDLRNSQNNQFENFCTEILCYCLQHDKNFLQQFLKKIGTNDNNTFELNTQQLYSDYNSISIPDIVMQSKQTIIFIENKIDSSEGEEQLTRYAKLLSEKYRTKKNKFLIYITRYYDNESRSAKIRNLNLLVEFKNMTWNEIANLIEDDDHFTKELKTFIQKKIMKTIKSVSANDIIALENISNVLEGYDGFLNNYADKLKKNWKLKFVKSKLLKTWVEQKLDYNLSSENLLDKSRCDLWFGICKNEASMIVICVEIDIYKEKQNKKIQTLKKAIAEKFESYPGELNDKEFDGYYIINELANFKDKSSKELEKWYDEQFEVVFTCIKGSGLKLLPIE